MNRITKDQAMMALEKMPLDDPDRKKLVDIIGYDPNDKWSEPLGEHSFAIAEMMQKQGIKPEL